MREQHMRKQDQAIADPDQIIFCGLEKRILLLD
jgi:hypothetical protein